MGEFVRKNQEHENTPFKRGLQESRHRRTIKELAGRPDKLVREWDLDIPEELVRDKDAIKQIVKKSVAKFVRGMNVFHKLESRYGVYVAGLDVVVGKNEKGRPKFFTVVDKVDGKNMWQLSRLSDEAVAEFDKFCSAMAQYYFDVWKEGGDYWWDIFGEQIVYGHKKGEENDEVYIVDLDPKYSTHAKDANASGIINSVSCVIGILQQAEEKSENKIRLKMARTTIEHILDQISENADFSTCARVQELEAALSQ